MTVRKTPRHTIVEWRLRPMGRGRFRFSFKYDGRRWICCITRTQLIKHIQALRGRTNKITIAGNVLEIERVVRFALAERFEVALGRTV